MFAELNIKFLLQLWGSQSQMKKTTISRAIPDLRKPGRRSERVVKVLDV